MAFGGTNIFPNDTLPSVAIGCDIPFNGGTVFTPNYETKKAIKNNLINYFLTNPGERPGNPTFGAGLREYLFTQISEDNLDLLKEDIQQKIITFFPRVALSEVELIPEADENRVLVRIKYSIINTDIDDQLEISFT